MSGRGYEAAPGDNVAENPDWGAAGFAALRDAARPEWDAYTRHAFVSGLGDGTLPRAAFLHYLVQDYIFLIHFSRAWALGVVKAGTVAEMRACAATVDGLVNHETALHVSICAEAGLSEADLMAADEAVENLAYTRYVLDAGHSGDFLDLLAALAPCVFGYGEIGRHLERTATSDAYRPWIDTYAGADYQGVCTTVGSLLTEALATRLGPDPTSGPRWSGLCHRFRTATRLEVGFWDMGLRGRI